MRKVAILPIGVTPTKPVTPSHLNGFVHAMILRDLLMYIYDTRLLFNARTWEASQQCLAFWAATDQLVDSAAIDTMTDIEIGWLYVRSQMLTPDPVRLQMLQSAVVDSGYRHPVSERLLKIWKDQLRRIGFDISFVTQSEPFSITQAQALDFLRTRDCLLDQRDQDGPLFMDYTDRGLSLRQIASRSGVVNYLLLMLMQILGEADKYEIIYIVGDTDTAQDVALLANALAPDLTLIFVPVPRVPINGQSRAAKMGGWEQVTFEPTFGALAAVSTPKIMRAAACSYFLASLGTRGAVDFAMEDVKAAHAIVYELASRLPVAAEGMPAALVEQLRDACEIRRSRRPDLHGLAVKMASRRCPPEIASFLLKVMHSG